MADEEFGVQIARGGDEWRSIMAALCTLRADLAVLVRDYSGELSELYAVKGKIHQRKKELHEEANRLNSERSRAHDDLRQLFRDLESARASVNRWHSKSKRSTWLGGSAGMKIPESSWFGQSHGDLGYAKSRRGQAVKGIDSAKGRIELINKRLADKRAEIERANGKIIETEESIAVVKQARQAMHDLRARGLRRAGLEAEIQRLELSLHEVDERQRTLQAQVAIRVKIECARSGLEERTSALKEVDAQRMDYIAGFDATLNQRARRQAHREEWMRRSSSAV